MNRPSPDPDPAANALVTPSEGVAPPTVAMPSVEAPTREPVPGIELHEIIGRGGMGTVYVGRQAYLDRRVAVKLLNRMPDPEGRFPERFRREAKILASLSHPNIVACHSAGVCADGHGYLVMELIEGPTLRKWLKAHGRMSESRGLRLVRDLAEALECAHERGVIHRDVKPDNILLQPRPGVPDDHPFPFVPKLADLGLARTVESDGDESAERLTEAHAIMGTPATMAPEQIREPETTDWRADIYALGCVAFEALTGRRAFPGSPADAMRAKLTGTIPDPAEAAPDLSPATAALVRWMLEPDRTRRPQSYREIVEHCEKADPEGAERTWRHEGVARTAKSRGLAVVAALAAIGAFAVFGAWRMSDDAPPLVPRVPPRGSSPPGSASPAMVAVDMVAPHPTGRPATKHLFEESIERRLASWRVAGEAVWASEDDGPGVVAFGGFGRLSVEAPPEPFRIAVDAADIETEAGLGLELEDGRVLALGVQNLQGSSLLAVNVFRTSDRGGPFVADDDGSPAREMLKTAPSPASGSDEGFRLVMTVADRMAFFEANGGACGSVALPSPPAFVLIYSNGAAARFREAALERY